MLNRPDVRNAFNDEVLADLAAWADRAGRDRTLRAAVLGGAGPVFCAGADLTWMARVAGYTQEENARDATAAAHTFAALNSLPVPLIGRVQGAAFGGGAGLVAVCDVVIAEEHTTFGFTEVKLGIIPAVVAPYALAKIGESAARELFLTGARFSARRAAEIGLVHEVVGAEQLDEAVAGVIHEFLGAGPEAIAAAKTLLRQLRDGSPPNGLLGHDTVALTARAIAERRASAEGQEGMRAFLDKRKARWNAT
jgi:methylglutaconyl-CoA hydratase